ncbi:probable protein S-acyltransferase 7 [Typha angustifolia]|uniref:probable protein S-acyltransferase 7 n=1 Tax=Typha angustifolia TaxID=59011 RepID=UPI003C2CB153
MVGRYKAPRPRRVTGSNQHIIETVSPPPKRVYQVWKGSNIFCLRGRLIFGPDWSSLLITVVLIVVPVILFAVFVSLRLVNDLHHQFGNLVLAAAVVFATYVIVLLFLTAGRDPGIVPRNSHPPEPDDDGGISPCLSTEWTGSQNGASSLPPTKDVLVNGVVVKVKYCNTCMLYRPPRCSHCSICNNCVERFDHHCPWVGQCIGKRNYRYFFMFVSSTTLLCLYVFTFCWVHLKKTMDAYKCQLWTAIIGSPISSFLILYTFIAAWFVGGLTVFHLYLICSNQTTYENFRNRYDGKRNPYNHGCATNIIEMFFSRIPKSRNNFRAKVKEESGVFFSPHSLENAISSDITKISFDLEVGGKREILASEEFDDIQCQIENLSGLERCGTRPQRPSWSSITDSWEITHDFEALSADFGTEPGFTERVRNHGSYQSFL